MFFSFFQPIAQGACTATITLSLPARLIPNILIEVDENLGDVKCPQAVWPASVDFEQQTFDMNGFEGEAIFHQVLPSTPRCWDSLYSLLFQNNHTFRVFSKTLLSMTHPDGGDYMFIACAPIASTYKKVFSDPSNPPACDAAPDNVEVIFLSLQKHKSLFDRLCSIASYKSNKRRSLD